MGLIEELQYFKDGIASGKHQGSEREAFVMTKAINNLMDRPPRELEGASRENIYKFVVSTAARTDTRKSSESILGTMDLGFGIPSTIFGEFPRRYQRSGLVKGAKETFEAHTGRREKLTPLGEQIVMDIGAFGVPAAIRYGMKRGVGAIERGISKRLTGSFGTYEGARAGAYRRWLQQKQLMAPATKARARGIPPSDIGPYTARGVPGIGGKKAGITPYYEYRGVSRPVDYFGTGKATPTQAFAAEGEGILSQIARGQISQTKREVEAAFNAGHDALRDRILQGQLMHRAIKGSMGKGAMVAGRKFIDPYSTITKAPRVIKKKVVGSQPPLRKGRKK